ncbi:MAG: ABC transporter ATP-binding protein [Bryobacterales bacterium]|nr:ABC transporter ATP-binding protein [Bryobacterales bacterium]
MEEEVLSKPYDAHLMRRLLAYARPYWRSVVAALVLMLIASAGQVMGPLLTKIAVDRYLAPAANRTPTYLDPYLSNDPWTGLTQIALIFLAVMIAGMIAQFGEGYLMMLVGQRAMFDLRRQLMAHLQRLDIAYFDRNPVGRLVTRVTTDVNALNELFSSGLVAIVGDILVLSFLIFAMLRLSVGMTLLILAAMPFVIGVTYLFRKAVQSSYRQIRTAVARINAFLQEHITGMSVVQLFNREAAARNQFDDANRAHMEAYKQAINAYGWFYPVVEFLGMVALAALLAYGGWRIERGELTLGVLVAFFQYGLRFFRPIQDLSEKYNIVQAAMAAGERVFQLADQQPGIAQPETGLGLPPARHGQSMSIEFDNVWFAYKDQDWVLRDVSFRIEPGETVAVVGHTGAGKTTLTNLLLRFYDIQKGTIRVGGIDIRRLDPLELRRRFAVVLQDPFLFTGDLAQNIRLGTKTITENQLRDATRRVNLLDFVDSLPDKFAHKVRERGAGLSTGQKQLISFARALAHDPQFLILDEATSSVDTETEQRIREALNQLLEGRTSIVIAHRLSTIQRADRILVMHKGELREIGTHQQLLAHRGIYWKLYQLQYKDQEIGKSR